MATTFRGWSEDCQRFFIGLELDNSKRYFDAHRMTYEESVKGPMVALIESLEVEYGPGKVFRPNRDVRFSKDKSPYKTNIAGYAGMGGRGGYLSLDARGLTVAAGRYEMTPAQLTKYRKRVAAEATGAPLAAIIATVEKAGYSLGGEALKRVPAGLPQDHPRARLLRHKLLYIYKDFGLQPWLGTPAARKHILKVWTDAEPLNGWLQRNIG
ncbi:MAG TPA: DUF2461 domain-containing protein [Candidatus Dormibacteraeota bacterium]|nr:DUF2461 domain-containing protein [Candidatus Dormibacteraeota bacterium]